MYDKIQTQIDSTIKRIAFPTECAITRIYEDLHVDIKSDYGDLTYVDTIGYPTENASAILIFLNNDYNRPKVIIDNKELIKTLMEE